MTTFVGIDPGVTGAIAQLERRSSRPSNELGWRIIESGWDITITDLPTLTIVGEKKKTVLDVHQCAAILRDLQSRIVDVRFYLEAPVLGPAMKKRQAAGPDLAAEDGHMAQSSLKTITGTFYLCGQIVGILATIGARYEIVNPQVWKRAMMPGAARDKDASRQMALQLFPGAMDLLKLKKHHNRAEALLLAEWGRRRG